jgi:hypothetical protein
MYDMSILKETNEIALDINLRNHNIDYNKLVEQYRGSCHCLWMTCDFGDNLRVVGFEQDCVLSFWNECKENDAILEKY